jgi:hypothetical protein
MSTPQKPDPPREGTSRAGCANRVYLKSPLAPNASPATKKRQTDKHQKRQKRAEQKAAFYCSRFKNVILWFLIFGFLTFCHSSFLLLLLSFWG